MLHLLTLNIYRTDVAQRDDSLDIDNYWINTTEDFLLDWNWDTFKTIMGA